LCGFRGEGPECSLFATAISRISPLLMSERGSSGGTPSPPPSPSTPPISTSSGHVPATSCPPGTALSFMPHTMFCPPPTPSWVYLGPVSSSRVTVVPTTSTAPASAVTDSQPPILDRHSPGPVIPVVARHPSGDHSIGHTGRSGSSRESSQLVQRRRSCIGFSPSARVAAAHAAAAGAAPPSSSNMSHSTNNQHLSYLQSMIGRSMTGTVQRSGRRSRASAISNSISAGRLIPSVSVEIRPLREGGEEIVGEVFHRYPYPINPFPFYHAREVLPNSATAASRLMENRVVIVRGPATVMGIGAAGNWNRSRHTIAVFGDNPVMVQLLLIALPRTGRRVHTSCHVCGIERSNHTYHTCPLLLCLSCFICGHDTYICHEWTSAAADQTDAEGIRSFLECERQIHNARGFYDPNACKFFFPFIPLYSFVGVLFHSDSVYTPSTLQVIHARHFFWYFIPYFFISE